MITQSSNHFEDKFLIDKLFESSWHFKNSNEFQQFFDFIASFDHYSRYNAMLVYIQNKNVRFFGGITYWKKKFNRQVSEEARPYIILAPKGPVMLVYDIFDTTGEDTPEQFLVKGLGRKPFEVNGHLSKMVFDQSIEEVRSWGIRVSIKPLTFFEGGHVTNHNRDYLEIALKEGASNEENFATLIHELAHVFLGHTGFKYLNNPSRKHPLELKQRHLPITAEELEAETVSYLLCYKLGLINSSAEYLAGYITDPEDLMLFEYDTVIKTADKLETIFLQNIKVHQPKKSKDSLTFQQTSIFD